MSKARQLAQKPSQPTGRKNLIINGAMQVTQRSTSVTGVSNGYHTADRWYLRKTGSGVTFDSDVSNDVLTCDNPSAATGFDLRHGIEWEDRFYGKTMTLTFTATTGSGTIHVDASVVDGSIANTTSEVSCHLTGTTTDITSYEGVGLVKSGNNYTITFDVPTDADVSFTPDMLRIQIGNTSAASQSITLTNVQLEVGSTATEFEHRSYGEELALCQRYYYLHASGETDSTSSIGLMVRFNGTTLFTRIEFPVSMRTPPSLVQSSSFRYRMAGLGNSDFNTWGVIEDPTENGTLVYLSSDSQTGSAGQTGFVRTQSSGARFAFNAEL
jgi:hypothetical protein